MKGRNKDSSKSDKDSSNQQNARYIFVTGGVVSSLGKGVAAASLGALLEARGYKILLKKLDPYLNPDPGTMSPFEHGEVFVTDDGSETDLDLGHYERFTSVNITKNDCITSGKIYLKLLTAERSGHHLGRTIQVVPHVTDEIKAFIEKDVEKRNIDFVICEIGGTVGDIEALPFLEAIRQFAYDKNKVHNKRVLFLHLTLVPYLKASKELKTKPTQHSVKELRTAGINADILICRSEFALDKSYQKKIALMCNVPENSVISAPDVEHTIYENPINFYKEKLDWEVLKHFELVKEDERHINNVDISRWSVVLDAIKSYEGEVNISAIGKYTGLNDSYKSLSEAFDHAGIANRLKVNVNWISSESLEEKDPAEILAGTQGVIVLPGFGERGVEGKLNAVNYARTKDIPFLGICLGMQAAVIEFARNVVGWENANSVEFNPNTDHPIVIKMTEWIKQNEKIYRGDNIDLGGSMRLGSYPCSLREGSLIREVYQKAEINERHRHRFEINNEFIPTLEKAGMMFTGISSQGGLPEICELVGHKWFIGVQFHPEFKSRPFLSHPLFCSFVSACNTINRLF